MAKCWKLINIGKGYLAILCYSGKKILYIFSHKDTMNLFWTKDSKFWGGINICCLTKKKKTFLELHTYLALFLKQNKTK